MKKKDAEGWEKTYFGILSRCRDKHSKYFKRGIKALISKEELKTLWFRDKAYLLKSPSIHRIDNDGDYTFENCQYIGRDFNASLGNSLYQKLKKERIIKDKINKLNLSEETVLYLEDMTRNIFTEMEKWNDRKWEYNKHYVYGQLNILQKLLVYDLWEKFYKKPEEVI
jgi:hypothetical protein